MTARFQPGPALIGAGALALVLLVLGAFQQPVSVMPIGEPVRVQYLPHPRQMMRIVEGTPYTVPAGSTFVLTGFGSNDLSADVIFLRVDGQPELIAHPAVNAPIHDVPIGFTVPAGATIELSGGVAGNDSDARALGYLVRE